MQCPRCKGQLSVRRLDEQTAKQECPSCGFSQVVEARDSQQTDRRMLTDDMPEPGRGQLNG